MAEFYTDHAPALCPRPPLVINTDPHDPGTVLAVVTDELRAADITLPTQPTAAPDRPAVDVRLAVAHQRLGGSTMLGGTVTDAFTYRGALMQMFQLASLTQTKGQTRLWNPYDLLRTDGLTGAAS